MRVQGAFVWLALAILLAGCGGSDSPLGSAYECTTTLEGDEIHTTFELREDGTYSGTTPEKPDTSWSGTYTVDGNRVTFVIPGDTDILYATLGDDALTFDVLADQQSVACERS